MRRSLFFSLLVFGSLVLSGCDGRGMQMIFDNTPTAPAPTEVAFVTPTPAAATPIATPTPVVIAITATPPPVVPPTETPDKKVGGPGRSTPPPAVDSPPPPTPTPTIPGLWLFDDFENPDNNGDFDRGLWALPPDDPITVEQNNGFLTLSRQAPGGGGLRYGPFKIEEIDFVEAKLMLDGNMEASDGALDIGIKNSDWWLACGIKGDQQDTGGGSGFNTSDGGYVEGIKASNNAWHVVRFEVNPITTVISCFVDGQQIGSYTPSDPEAFKQVEVNLILQDWSRDGGLITGYIDDVRVGKAQAGVSAVDPALYDDFNDERYEGTFDLEKWATTVEQPSGQIEQQEGKLILSFIPGTDITSIGIGTDEAFKLNELGFMEAEIYLSNETVKQGYGEISTGLYTPLNNSQDLVFSCSIYKNESSAEVGCEVWVFDKSNSNSTYQPEYVSEKKPTSFDTPHIVRIEVDPEASVTFYIDNQPVGSHKPNNAAEVKGKDSKPTLWIVRGGQNAVTARVDNVRIGRLGQQ